MPATNFNWPFNEQPPVYQVFGTKRKNCTDESNQDVVEEMETKRRCTAVRQFESEAMNTMDHTESLNHPSPFTHQAAHNAHIAHNQTVESHMYHQTAMHSSPNTHNLAQHHQQVLMNTKLPPLPNAAGDNEHNNNSLTQTVPGYDLNSNQFSQSLQTDLQNNMLMDLNEGVYSTDILPLNPQTDAEYEAACSMMATMDGEGAPDPQQYSSQNTGVVNSAAGRVRCLCRPSWDGVMDVQPYVSDYY